MYLLFAKLQRERETVFLHVLERIDSAFIKTVYYGLWGTDYMLSSSCDPIDLASYCTILVYRLVMISIRKEGPMPR